ncbi:hypothetical protein B0H10DRAFT_1728216, partial [Mycena sp. CBHHK59/15]
VAKTAEADQQTRHAKERAGDLKDEIERLRRQIHELQQESADKDVKILQIPKQRAQDKQDLQGLNNLLDYKQQELAILKRRMGVRGTGRPTPAKPSKIGRQRSGLASRPPSVLSDAGTVAKIPGLSKSTRLNSSNASSTKLGSIGPPAPVAKPRTSLAGASKPMLRVTSTLSRSAPTARAPPRASMM